MVSLALTSCQPATEVAVSELVGFESCAGFDEADVEPGDVWGPQTGLVSDAQAAPPDGCAPGMEVQTDDGLLFVSIARVAAGSRTGIALPFMDGERVFVDRLFHDAGFGTGFGVEVVGSERTVSHLFLDAGSHALGGVQLDVGARTGDRLSDGCGAAWLRSLEITTPVGRAEVPPGQSVTVGLGEGAVTLHHGHTWTRTGCREADVPDSWSELVLEAASTE